ncbi:APC family permease [Paeniglutamicibacter kerguelensis]|uniref:Amino acid transporter n=1 Tax=Paeniglutamicibacter kerguelensis TaxID=254788 RepID=A0ABS4XGK3_9MICC|nr:amino acid permease [Paeniglutamicibacter kerguelensis]MBP2387528.1 amino acid transporter [Paeniglutamicibacter kerguelensis]
MSETLKVEQSSASDAPLEGGPVLKREMGFWSSFSLAFAFMSPIIGLYAVFALALTAAGPSFWWGMLVVLACQCLVALVLAELASRWPVAGGVCLWSRSLLGHTYSWYAGWAYIWTLVITVAAVSYGGSTFLASFLGWENPSSLTKVLLGAVILAISTIANSAGRRWLSLFVTISIICEVIASLGVGLVLIIFYRKNSLSTIFESFSSPSDSSAYIFGPFLAAVAIIGWSFVGFESAGAIAEEVRSPERKVPRAIITSLITVASVITFSALALLLAIPDLKAAVSGADPDPISTTLTTHFGVGISRPLLILIVLGFIAGVVALQAAVSRAIFAFARIDALPAAKTLRRLSKSDSLPINAVLVSAVASMLILAISASQVYGALISFATVGFYIAFAFPVVAALIVRLKGEWKQGPFSLGKFGLVINVAAVLWLGFEIINIAWPRMTDGPWYQNYSVIIIFVLLGISGYVLEKKLRKKSSSLI